jgi:hypothetical protein
MTPVSDVLRSLLLFSLLHLSPSFVAVHNGQLDSDLAFFISPQTKRYHLCNPKISMCGAVDPITDANLSVEKALKRRQRLHSTPLSQRWYKLRQRQITPAQRKSLRELWPLYGVDLHHNTSLDLPQVIEASQYVEANPVAAAQLTSAQFNPIVSLRTTSAHPLLPLIQTRPGTGHPPQ